MRSWIRRHCIAAFFAAVLALAGMGGVLAFFYFTYWFSLTWANVPGAVQPSQHRVAATYVNRRGLRSITRSVEAEGAGLVFQASAALAGTRSHVP
jgi:hypothetical protein